MTALAARIATRADPLQVLIARAEARGILYREGDLDLHEAVDVLQAAAVQTGLVGALGQDAVQAIMAKAFAGVRADADANADAEPDAEADAEAGAEVNQVRHLERHEHAGRDAVAKSTIDATDGTICASAHAAVRGAA